MTTAAKVFIIMGMVFQCFMIFPIIVGAIALKKLKTATTKSELTGIAIVTLLFCNLIGGILMLCIDEKDLAPVEDAVAIEAAAPVEENTAQ